MRVLLINPWEGEIFPPPSIGYLRSALNSIPEAETTSMDLSLAIKEPDNYDLVAVSFHSFSVKHAIKIREHFKGRLICGGHHPSAMPDQMIAIGYDQVVIGEGDNAIKDMVQGNVNQIIYGQISEINNIPYPDYSGLAYEGSMGPPIISSRGCPFACNFCASTHFWHRKWRMRSADNVLNELSYHINRGVKTWMFEDDNFTANRGRAIDICSGISEMGQYNWQCASRAETLQDEDLVRAMALAGCKTVWLGIESLSQDSLSRCNKNTTVEKMLKGIEVAEKHGIETMSQFIIGIPGDTIKDIEETAKRVRQSSIRRKGSNILWILPGTKAYSIAKQRGFDDNTYLVDGAPYYTYEHDIKTLQSWANMI
jgi:radical SAM superfamily enzyme YgiQ (UPF0313 family)